MDRVLRTFGFCCGFGVFSRMSDTPREYRHGMILRTPEGETLIYPFADTGPAWSISGPVPPAKWLPWARALPLVGIFAVFAGWEFNLHWLYVAGPLLAGGTILATIVVLKWCYHASGPHGLIFSARIRARTVKAGRLRLGGGALAVLSPPPTPVTAWSYWCSVAGRSPRLCCSRSGPERDHSLGCCPAQSRANCSAVRPLRLPRASAHCSAARSHGWSVPTSASIP